MTDDVYRILAPSEYKARWRDEMTLDEALATAGKETEEENEKRQSCAIMNDSSVVLIKSLAHQVKLAASGKVKQFSFVDKLPSRNEGLDWGLVLSEKRLQDALDWHRGVVAS